MHKMEETPKILTILGLIIEGLAFLVYVGANIIVRILAAVSKTEWLNEGFTSEDAELMVRALPLLASLFLGIAILLLIMFVINLFIFIRLIKGGYTEDQAKKIYLYQAIWGGISLTFNTISGVLYLISAVQTHSKRYLSSMLKNE